MSGGNVYIRRNTRVRVSSRREEGKTVTTGRERPVRGVEANEFDRKSFPRGSSLRAADAIYSRAMNSRMRKRKLRAPRLRRSFACLTWSHRAIIPSLNQSASPVLADVPPGNREVKLIVFHSFVLQLDSLACVSRLRGSRRIAREQNAIPKRDV